VDVVGRERRSLSGHDYEVWLALFPGLPERPHDLLRLRLVYPEDQSFHVEMAREKVHLDKLGADLEERLGSKPRLEVRAAGGEAPATEESPPTAAPSERRPAQAASEEIPPQTGDPDGAGGTIAETPGTSHEAKGDDVIRNQREVFEMARELYEN
jgi:hypothetical protein